jgi:polar amino acid transport system substrate-binding protein
MDISQHSDSESNAKVAEQEESSHSSGPGSPSPKTSYFPLSFPIKFFLIVIIFIGALLGLVWFYQQNLEQGSVVPQPTHTPPAVMSKKIVVGVDATLPPMEYLDNGDLTGYDIDLTNYLANELDVEVEFKNIVFDDLFSELEKNNIDMIISAVTITEERQQKYDFSDSYLNAGQIIITQRGDTSIISTADLKNKRIGVQKGTTNEQEALNYTSDSLVIRYPDFSQATKALVDGKVDAIFTDLPNAKGIIATNPTLKISSDPFTNEYYGIVLRKDDPFVADVNEALTALRVKGVLTDLKQKWLD